MNDNRYDYEIAPVRGSLANNERVNTVKGNKNKTDMEAFRDAQAKMGIHHPAPEQKNKKLSGEEKAKLVPSLKYSQRILEGYGIEDSKKLLQIAKLHWHYTVKKFYHEEHLTSAIDELLKEGVELLALNVEDEMDRQIFGRFAD